MSDKTVVELRNEVLQELDDVNQHQFEDTELVHYINDALRYVKYEIARLNKHATVPEEFPYDTLDYTEFSSDNKHDLPTDYSHYIMIKRSGKAKSMRGTTPDRFDDTTTQNRFIIHGGAVGAPVPNSSNSGTDDLVTKGNKSEYSGGSDITVTIEIDAGGATYSWSDTDGNSGSGVSIPTEWSDPSGNGWYIKFDSSSGYTAGDEWTFSVYNSQVINILELNFNPEEDIKVWYSRRIEEISLSTSTLPSDTYLPLYRYYDAIKQFVILKARNRNEESIRQDIAVLKPVTNTVLRLASSLHTDDDLSVDVGNVSEDYI